MQYESPYIYYSLACFMFILSGLFCAYIRWTHMCHPYNQQADYFYPARRQLTFFFAMLWMQFPYVIQPADEATWLYVRIFNIVYYPICFAMLFHRYFRMDKYRHCFKSAVFFILPFLLLCTLLAAIVCGQGQWFMAHCTLLEVTTAIVSVLLMIRFLQEGWWLNRKIDEYHTQNFSNESDFPYTFAKKVIFLPLIWIAVMWAVFFADSRMLKLIIDLLFGAWMIMFLGTILHPNRSIRSNEESDRIEQIELEKLKEEYEQTEAFENDLSEFTNSVVVKDNCIRPARQADEKEMQLAKQEVLQIVSQRYLEPSLKRIDVVRNVVKVKQSVAGNFITQVGFYKLVNAFRLRHYDKLMTTSTANLSQDQIAEKCGFKNRWALTNAKKRMEDFDYTIIDDFI